MNRSEVVPSLLHVTTVPSTFRAFFRGQLSHMRDMGFTVEAISSPGPLLEEFGKREGVRVTGIHMTRGYAPFGDVLALGRLRGSFRRLGPTIVHAHTPKAGLLAMLAARGASVPVRIYHLHGLRFATAGGSARRVLLASERMACRLAHRVFCVGPSLREAALSARVAPNSKLRTPGPGSINGVDAEKTFDPTPRARENGLEARARWGIPRQAPVLGFVGRLTRDKGVEDLLAAWELLRREFPELHLLLVGPFESGDPIDPRTRAALADDPRVHLTGEQWETVPLYATMEVLVLPSHREGFPVVPLEAAAMELPVVATRVVGCLDAVQDGITGTLVPPGDPPALGAALRSYLRDPELRRDHGRTGRQRVLRAFRPRAVWQALYDEYASLLDQAGLPLPRR